MLCFLDLALRYSLILILVVTTVNGFSRVYLPTTSTSIKIVYSSSSSALNINNYFESSSEYFLQRNVELSLVEFSKIIEEDEEERCVVPLPSAELPDEASTLNIYAYKLKGASYERLLEKVESKSVKQLGMLVSKGADPSDESGFIGGIGCAMEVIAEATTASGDKEAILTRGTFRFIVRKIESTFPFITAIVDELPDIRENKPPASDEQIFYSDFEQDLDNNSQLDDDDINDSPLLNNVPPSQLLAQCVQAMKSYVEILNNKPPLNPLQISILEGSGISPSAAKATAEEKSAVLQIFLYDVLPEFNSPPLRYLTTAMLAAEIGAFDNPTRIQMLQTRDPIFRLKLALQALQRIISQEQARKIAEEVTKITSSEGDDQDLKVGAPSMPPWVRQLGIGTRVEYYWNEEWDWCAATIVDVQKIVDEYIFTLKFDDDEDGDDALIKVPFLPEDKVRWRPISTK